MSAAPDADGEPRDTSDLRDGAAVHDDLLALLPLVGRWRGEGTVTDAAGNTVTFAQRIDVRHDGRPFLVYEAVSWDPADSVDPAVRAVSANPASVSRESGFWRPGVGPDDIEAVLAKADGGTLVFTGAAGDQRWELVATAAAATATGVTVDAERRLYALRGDTPDELVYAIERTPAGGTAGTVVTALLVRVTGALARVSAAAGPGPG